MNVKIKCLSASTKVFKRQHQTKVFKRQHHRYLNRTPVISPQKPVIFAGKFAPQNHTETGYFAAKTCETFRSVFFFFSARIFIWRTWALQSM